MVIFKQRGMASAVAIVLIMLLLAIGLAFSRITIAEIAIGESFQSGIAAQYIAEAGIHKAIYQLQIDSNWQGTDSYGENFNDGSTLGSLRINVYRDSMKDNLVVVQSVGKVGSAERIVSFAYVWPPGGESNAIYEYTLFAGDDLTIEEASSIDGVNIGSCKNVYVDNKMVAVVSNKRELSVPVIPSLSYSFIQNKILAQPPGGEEISNITPLTGRVYLYKHRYNFPYSIAPYQTLSGNGVIYSAEAIKIGENVRIPSRVVLISESSISIGKNAVLDKVLLVARQNIDIEEGVKLTGCAVAGGKVKVGKHAKIISDTTVKAKIKTNYWLN